MARRFLTPADLTKIKFNQSSDAGLQQGEMIYDSEHLALMFGLSPNVKMELGQSTVILVYNDTLSSIPAGRAVYGVGVQNQRPSVVQSVSSSMEQSSRTFGITAESIPAGGSGWVVTQGLLGGVDTSSYLPGDELWLSSTTPGVLVTSPVGSPNYDLLLGYCVVSSATNGVIYVSFTRGVDVAGIHDIVLTGLASGDVLRYNSTSGYWENQPLSSLGGGATVSETPPTSPSAGDIWFNSATAETFIYYDSTWVEVGEGGGSGLTEPVQGIDFDTVNSDIPAVGRIVWDDGEGTFSFGLKGGNVNLQLGQENVALCYNGTGSTIPDGSVVYINGAQGQRPSITLAQANSEATSSKVLGIATEPIANGAEGFVATFGVVNGVDTSAFTAGDALWLSPTVAGGITATKPVAPNHMVFVGYALHINASSGRIFVNPQNGYELDELHDVLITSKANNDILAYNSTSGLWENTASPTFNGTLTTSNINSSGNILPVTDNTGVIGNATNTWSNGQFTNLTIDSTLSVRAAIDLADSDVLRWGSSDDVTSLYDGTNNTLDINFATAAASSINIQAAGVDVITLARDGNITATGFSGSGANLTSIPQSAITNLSIDLSNKQPLDADLTAIAGLAGTSGFLKKTAADTWTLDTNTYLTTAVTSVAGTANEVLVNDATAAATGAVTLSLPATINANTTGNAATVTNGVYTTGSYADPSWITSLAWSKISGEPNTLSGYGITDALNTSATEQTKSGNLNIGGNLVVTGNLTINGTTTTINSTTISVDDKNIELGAVATPTNATANGGGITLLAGTDVDKTIIWDSTNTNWTSSEHWNIATGKSFKINNVSVLNATTLGSGVTDSSLTKIGTAAGLVVSDASGNLTVTTNNTSNWDSAFTQRLQWDGGSTNLVAATGRTSLGATTVGSNLFTLANPSAIRFIRINADNTVSALDAATFRTAIGAGTSSTTGTVTSVAMTVPTGLTISGTPITSSGTFAVSLTAGYEIPQSAAIVHIAGTETMTGVKLFNAGAETISLLPGSQDHTYIGFYARTASPGTRSAYLGFPAAANNNLTIANQISGGNINLVPTGTGIITVGSDIQLTNSDPEIEFNNGGPRLRVPAANTLAFHTGGGLGASTNERMRIDSAGDVGIATSDPQYRLHVQGSTSAGGIWVESNSTSNASPAVRVTGKRSDANGSAAFAGKVVLERDGGANLSDGNDIIGTVIFGGNYNTSAGMVYPASIAAVTDTTWTGSAAAATGIAFYTDVTGPTASDTANVNYGTERMRITSAGNVVIGATSTTYKLEVVGSFAATTKSFVIDHPTKPDMKLRYGSLEGPENGVYVRGKTRSSIITLPDYWTGLVDEDSITVQLTPYGNRQRLYVKNICDNTVEIGGVKGEFYYFIQAERKDVDKLVVEYGDSL